MLLVDADIELTPDATHHLVNVLRLKPGHPLVLFNGDGHDYPAQLSQIDKRHAYVKVDAKIAIQVESPLPIHLAQGVSKGDRMDFAIQKAVELGVTAITPLVTEFCAVKLNQARWEKKQQQWHKIIIGACEQSGRNVVPTINPTISLTEYLSQSTQQLRLILDPNAEQNLKDITMPRDGVRLLIGPEGGLSEKEVYQAQQAGYQGSLLGPRILRTETAALAAISVLQSHFGDL